MTLRAARPSLAALLLTATACVAAPTAPRAPTAPTAPSVPTMPAVPADVRRPASLEELIRIRCALDEGEVVTTWTGTLYSFVPGERQRRLFDLVGMNIARCLRVGAAWHLTSRELMYYLQPGTGEVLDRWRNPWTDTEVPVVHVANRLVQAELGGAPPLEVLDGVATLILDIPLFYPGPFARDPALRPFSPAPDYQAGEFFALAAPAAAALDPARATVPTMTFGWHRIGPWLPWMQMGERPGHLFYRSHGHKVASVAALPEVLRREITERLPLYQHAPTCVVPGRNETSWSYFARALPSYQSGARFPLPAPTDPTECPAPTAPAPSSP